MKTYIVNRKEIYLSQVKIEANSRAEAIALVEADEGDELRIEWLETMDSDSWTVFEVQNPKIDL